MNESLQLPMLAEREIEGEWFQVAPSGQVLDPLLLNEAHNHLVENAIPRVKKHCPSTSLKLRKKESLDAESEICRARGIEGLDRYEILRHPGFSNG